MTDERDRPGAIEWLSFAFICGSMVLSALLEVMFLGQFYAGTVIIPVVVLAAIVGNLMLPWWGSAVLASGKGAVIPVVLWLVVVLVLTLYNRPEGDVFVLGNEGQQYAFYGLLFGGAIAGFVSIVLATGRRPVR
jgi:hypothetical protein